MCLRDIVVLVYTIKQHLVQQRSAVGLMGVYDGAIGVVTVAFQDQLHMHILFASTWYEYKKYLQVLIPKQKIN